MARSFLLATTAFNVVAFRTPLSSPLLIHFSSIQQSIQQTQQGPQFCAALTSSVQFNPTDCQLTQQGSVLRGTDQLSSVQSPAAASVPFTVSPSEHRTDSYVPPLLKVSMCTCASKSSEAERSELK